MKSEAGTMRKFFLTVAGLAAFGAASSAVAADLPARTYTKAPPMIAAIYDWSGFYIGANGGGGTSRNCWDINKQLRRGPGARCSRRLP